MRVHEPGEERGASEIEREVGRSLRRPEPSFGDVARRVFRLEAQPHFEKRSARSSGRPSVRRVPIQLLRALVEGPHFHADAERARGVEGEPRLARGGLVGVRVVHDVLDDVRGSGGVAKRARVPAPDGVRVEVRHDGVPALAKDPRELAVQRRDLQEVPGREPAPHDVEALGGEGQRPEVAARGRARPRRVAAAGRQHLEDEVHPAGRSSARAPSGRRAGARCRRPRRGGTFPRCRARRSRTASESIVVSGFSTSYVAAHSRYAGAVPRGGSALTRAASDVRKPASPKSRALP